ncbi:MAG: HDOD domain-containing protein, partial [Salinibacter sp.]
MSDLESSSRVTEGHADLQIPPIPRALPKVLAPLHESGFAGQEAVFAAIDCQPSLEERILNHINAR